jgi:competence protein ComEA
MFRGLYVSEVRLTAALLAGLFIGVVAMRRSEEAPRIPTVGERVVLRAAPDPTPTPAPTPPPTPVPPEQTATPTPTPKVETKVEPTTAAPSPAPPVETESAPRSSLTAGGQLDLNRATAEELELLPGIGPSKAAAIVEDRTRRGPFRTVEDLDRVTGFGPKTVRTLAPHLTVLPHAPGSTVAVAPPASPPAPSSQVSINSATLAELMELEGVGEVTARRIIDFRQEKGPIRSFRDLEKIKGIGPSFTKKNQERVRFD